MGSLVSYSQQQRKLVFAGVSSQFSFIADAHVVNLQTGQGTFTNEIGEFKILAKNNDTLKISYVGYQTKLWKVENKHFGLQENRIVLVKEEIILNEVQIEQTELLGNLISDTKLVPYENEINAETLKLPYAGSRILTKAEREIYTATTSQGGIPLDPLLNWISGRLKKLKKNLEIERTEKQATLINAEYHNYIISNLNIKENDLERFIYYVVSGTELNPRNIHHKIYFINYLKEQSIKFKELNQDTYSNLEIE